jgi:hypothetical protein
MSNILEEFKRNQKIAFDNGCGTELYEEASIRMDELWFKLDDEELQIVQEYERSLWINSGKATD